MARSADCKFRCNTCSHVVVEQVPAQAVPADYAPVVPPGGRLPVKGWGHIEEMSVQTLDENDQVVDECKIIVNGKRVNGNGS
ncbi:MAG: hypothetical protein PVJ27_09440 [Candidatus Brocadiaceae bacterium]